MMRRISLIGGGSSPSTKGSAGTPPKTAPGAIPKFGAGSPAKTGGPAATPKAAPKPKPIPVDETFTEGSLVFIPDENECFLPAKVLETFKQGDAPGKCEMLGGKKQIVELGKEQTRGCLQMDSQSLEPIEDMVELRALNDGSLLHNLRLRYFADDIYTNIGAILVSVNPFKMLDIYTPETMESYLLRRNRNPHIFRLADEAFRAMSESKTSQSCIVAGESGAGKTEATKLFLQYLAEVSPKNLDDDGTASVTSGTLSRRSSRGDSRKSLDYDPEDDKDLNLDKPRASLQDKILEANPLLEAFGNAKTVRNDNSSRFGKWIAVVFDTSSGTIVGGSITSYLLERTRVVHVMDGERGYHVFYQLCAAAGLDSKLRKRYGVTAAEDFYYTTQSSCVDVEGVNDARGWQQTMRAIETIGLGSRLKEITQILAGILHLGNVDFVKPNDKAVIGTRSALERASTCFGVSASLVEAALCQRTVMVRGEKISKDLTPAQAVMARDALAKVTYGLLFDWLLRAINESLGANAAQSAMAQDVAVLNAPPPPTPSKTDRVKYVAPPANLPPPKPVVPKFSIIGVLDIFGFESFQHNSFEQLCINYCNEKLQGHFNEHVFKLEQSVYSNEGLDVSMIEFHDNEDLLSLLESKPSGLFHLMDEENALPHGSDEGYLRSVFELTKSHAEVYGPLLKKPEISAVRRDPALAYVFTIVHYAGPVDYTVSGFLDKNKDEVAPEVDALLESSSVGMVVELWQIGTAMAAAALAAASTSTRRKSNVMQGNARGTKASVGSKFKDELTNLMDTLRTTQPHFVRCIKPNVEKIADTFTGQMVLSQLRCSGLLEVCRIRKNGYPIRKLFSDFAFRYAPLVQPVPRKGDHGAVLAGLQRASLLPDKRLGAWQQGKTQLFMRSEVFNLLEIARDDRLKDYASSIQKLARGFVARRKYRKFKSTLHSLTAAVQDGGEAALEQAILDAGGLPHSGYHVPQMRRAREALAAVRAQNRARKMIQQACVTRDMHAIRVALDAATSVGINVSTDAVCKTASALVTTLQNEAAARAALREAIASKSVQQIDKALDAAYALGMDSEPDADEARQVKKRVQQIEALVKQLDHAISEAKSPDFIMKLVSHLVELVGGRQHPAVQRGEAAAHRIAEISAAHAKKVQGFKTELEIAAKDEDLTALVSLAGRAAELGLSEDQDVVKLLALRAVLERKREAAKALISQVEGLKVRSDRVEGIHQEDVVVLSEAIRTALGVLEPTHEAVKQAQDFEALALRQITARQMLESALEAHKSGQDADGQRIKAAMDSAMQSGLSNETARRGQAALAAIIEAEAHRAEAAAVVAPALLGGQQQLPAAAKARGGGAPARADAGGMFQPVQHTRGASIRPSVIGAPVVNITMLPKATAEERVAICQQRVAAANSPDFQALLQSAAVNDLYEFDRYLGLRSDEDYTEFDAPQKRRKHARRKCRHSVREIPKSLLVMDAGANLEALKVNKSILGWAGDASAQFPPTLAQSVLKVGQTREGLRDEIFAQCMKQLTDNPEVSSEDRMWILLCIACESFPPSADFLPFLLRFLSRRCQEVGTMPGNYAKWCLYQLGATFKLGTSPYQVSIKEIETYTSRPPVILKIHQVFRVFQDTMAWSEIPVWPDNDVAFVEKVFATATRLGPEIQSIAGLFLKDIPNGNINRFMPPPTPVSRAVTASSGGGLPPSVPEQTVFTSTLPSSPTGTTPTLTSPKSRVSMSLLKTLSRKSTQGSGKKGMDAGASGISPLPSPTGNGPAHASTKSFRLMPGSKVDQFISVSGTSKQMVSAGAGDGGGGGAPAGAVESLLNPGRVPPPPFAPWPLPGNFYLGDVFMRLVKQDRLPFLTYQRKLFLEDDSVKGDKAVFVQILQDVSANRLPITSGSADIAAMAALAMVRAIVARKSALPHVSQLIEAGLFTYIPASVGGAQTPSEWTQLATSFIEEHGLLASPPKTEEWLMAKYVEIAKKQPLFGASLFSVIRKDVDADFVAAVNFRGLNVLTNDGTPKLVGSIPFPAMSKIGASGTFVWVAVSEEVQFKEKGLFTAMGNNVLYLHTQQARELYSLLTEYTYYFQHKTLRSATSSPSGGANKPLSALKE